MRTAPAGHYYNMGNLTPLPVPFSPYHFDKSACTEPMTGVIHAFAITAAIACRWDFCMVTTIEEVMAAEREAAAWNHPNAFNGD